MADVLTAGRTVGKETERRNPARKGRSVLQYGDQYSDRPEIRDGLWRRTVPHRESAETDKMAETEELQERQSIYPYRMGYVHPGDADVHAYRTHRDSHVHGTETGRNLRTETGRY